MSEYEIHLIKRTRNSYFKLVSVKNGQTILTSETYLTTWSARRTAKKLVAKNGFTYREYSR